ncbi:amino acid ABC transporter substrate-binding protein [Propionivibrio sp.]|uniref:amino acid ABC transporter substrate-binding protein n=1 Tax=Propionivibrio sp. TaxID=2212460 RepID=UPI002621BAA1|nr:amino acid ABC transporter substrate-binding protein [Propionivibrio sp.]
MASGSVTLGYRDSSAPFSYLDERRRPIGYSIDICMKVVEAIRRELKRPDLAVKFTPVTSASRQQALISGDIDLECGSTTATAERRKIVSFTIPTFFAATRLMTRETSAIKSIYDLAGKTVVTTKGTSSEKFFNELNLARSLRTALVLGKDHAESFSTLEAGKADAFIMDDVLLYSLRAASKDPAKYVITRDALTVEPLSLMLRKDDWAFKKVVDNEVIRIILQGEINAIYRKWFESPIPPQQINLNLPMSYMLRDSFKVPTDWIPE